MQQNSRGQKVKKMNRYIGKRGFLNLVAVTGLAFLIISPADSATYYVRLDGGTATQCTGLADAPYPGSGNNRDCAFSHPFWAISPIGNNPTKMAGGDTLIIDGSNGAQYKIGLGAPNTSDTSKCSSSWPWDCVMRKIPSGPDPTNPTKILGKGWNTGCSNPPQLWGTERAWQVLDLRGSNNVELQCLEITDHSACQRGGPNSCNGNSYPYGPWASTGIEAADSANVLIKNVNVHGLAHKGIHAGRLRDWTLEDTKIVANSFVGWDGDIGANVSSNSGTMTFNRVTIAYNGCGETYPDKQPYNCYSQDQGGYGDGLGTHKTGANWVFNNSDISHNVSDGLDLLYHDGTGTVTIKRSRFEGNAGNQVKTATNTTIENSLIIGNCAYFKNNPITWQSSTFNNCRAFGNSVALSFRAGMSAAISNSTITTNGDNLILTMGDGCNGTEVLESRNNIFLGGPDYNGGDTSDLYYASGLTGNGDGACGALKLNDDYSIIYRTKTIASNCIGKPHSKCQDPKFVEPLVSYYTGNAYNVNLQSISPAVGNALVLTGKSSLDYYNNERGTVWDIGAVEYGIVSTQPTCKDGIQYCTTQTDCTNNGHYWYNSTCNTQPKPLTCADGIQYCLTQTDCTSNGHYWYNNTCNAQTQPAPTCADGAQYCKNKPQCANQGYYWYNNTCNAQPQLTCADGIQYCLTQTDCVNNGHYWYSNTCNAQPKAKTCADGIQYCATQTACEGQNYFWYNNTCNAQPKPLTCADGIQYCSTKSECEGLGYYWYANSCNLEPKGQPTPQSQQEQKQEELLSSVPTTSTSESDSSRTLPTTTESIGDNSSTTDISPETTDTKVASVDQGSSQPKSLTSGDGDESKNTGTGKPGKGGRGGGGGGGKGGGGGGSGKSSGGSSGGGTSLIGTGGGLGVPTNVFNAPSPVQSTGMPGELPSNLIKGTPQAKPSQSAKRVPPTAAPQPAKGVAPTTASQPIKGESPVTVSQPAAANKPDSALITPSLHLTDTTSISLTRDDIAAQAEVAPEPTVEPEENVNLTPAESETPPDKTAGWINDLWRKMLRWFSGG